MLHIVVRCQRAFAEEQTDAPNACQAHKRINNAADDTGLTAEDPCDEVELKNTDQTPVQRTDNAQNQC